MKVTMWILPLLALALVMAPPASAQEPAEAETQEAPPVGPTGNVGLIVGIVLDFNQQPIQGARFIIEPRTGGGAPIELVTAPDGQAAEELAPGEYSMRLVVRGVNIQEYDRVQIQAGSITEAAVDLSTLPANTRAAIEDAWEEREADEAAVDAFGSGRDALMSQQYERAIELFQQALEAQPTQHVIMANLAEAFNGARRYPEAIAQYQSALELVPEEPVYHRNLGSIYAFAGQTDEARAAAGEAARLDPPNAGQTYYQIGAAFLNSGNMAEAANAFETTIEHNPNHADAHYYLALTLLGDAETMSEAVALMEKYVELAPDGPNADAARGIIEQLGGVD